MENVVGMGYEARVEQKDRKMYLETSKGLGYLRGEIKRSSEEAGISEEQMMDVVLAICANGDGASIAKKLKKYPTNEPDSDSAPESEVPERKPPYSDERVTHI